MLIADEVVCGFGRLGVPFGSNRYGLEPDLTTCGGITPFMKVARLAEAHNLPLISHGAHQLHIHLLAACPNAAVMLFTGAKISQLALLPQGRPEAARRAIKMLKTMDRLGFGNCTNERECEVECPKEISISNIARMRWEFIKSSVG